MRAPLTALAAAAAVFGGFLVLRGADPDLFTSLTAEEAAAESLTAVLFGGAALAAIAALARRSTERGALWAILIFSSVALLDEISFGKAWLGYTAPTVAGVKIDAVHDLLSVVRNLGRQALGGAFDAAVAAAIAAAAALVLSRRDRIVRSALWRALSGTEATRSLTAALAMTAVAQALDLRLPFAPDLITTLRVEEALELSAALAVCLLALGLAGAAGRSGAAALGTTRRMPMPAE